MNKINYLDYDEKLLINGLFFCELRGHKTVEDKINILLNYLSQGADVNASDANDYNNTPLHIAVKKNEPDIVRFLLQVGANPESKNTNTFTPLELVRHLHKNSKRNFNEIINILDTSNSSIERKNKESVVVTSKVSETLPSKIHIEKRPIKRELINQTRPGTAGNSGQLYETKLLALLLYRVQNDKNIEKFYLGTNVVSAGAFDDIVLKYYLKDETYASIMFIQAKHKDNYKLTVDNLLNPNSDFGLLKYYESYMVITKSIKQKEGNVMFQSDFHTCSFIIYTSAIESLNKKKLIEVNRNEILLSTSDTGKVFMFDYVDSDIMFLLENTTASTLVALAKKLARSFAKNKYETLMFDELIEVYHVYLSHNVFQISCCDSENYVWGSFRDSFLNSKNKTLIRMRETMFKEYELHCGQSMNSESKFKLPMGFGNINVSFGIEDCLNLCKVIETLEKNAKITENIVLITVDDSMIGRNKLIKNRNTITKLVGVTLINDNETGFLKFNTDVVNTAEMMQMIKNNLSCAIDLQKFRFEFNVQKFPQLGICNEKNQSKNIIQFLNSLIFYTDQGREGDVEKILKNEINSNYINENKQSDNFYCIKGDAIYLKYHDKIHKWWKSPDEYLTQNCKYYQEAKNDFLDSPLLNVYSYIYITKLNSYKLNFNHKAVDSVSLAHFLSDSNVVKLLSIITADIILTSIKVAQYIKSNISFGSHKFIHLDIVISNGDSDMIISEILATNMDILILLISKSNNQIEFLLNMIVKSFKKKVVLISNSQSLSEDILLNYKCLEQDDQNNLCDLDTDTRHRIVEQNFILFQGTKVSFKSMVNDHTQNCITEKVLHNIINGEEIQIGKGFTITKSFDLYKDLYINRQLSRCLKLIGNYRTAFYVISDKNHKGDNHNKKDIILISSDKSMFEKICRKYDVNIHWFRSINGTILWEKSSGGLRNILPFVERCQDESYSFEPQTLKDFSDRVVLISGWPGMGKSTLATHLILQTKYFHNTHCVLRLNFLDFKNKFIKWQACDIKMRIPWLLLVFYQSFSIYETDSLNSVNNDSLHNITEEILPIIFVDSDNRMRLSPDKAKNLLDELAVLEFQVFLNLYNGGEISIVFDGFDEICPHYKNEAIELLKVLMNSRVKYMLITSRSYNIILEELECALNTFSFTLNRLSRSEQLSFLENVWKNHTLQTVRLSSQLNLKNINVYVTQFFDAITYTIKDYKNEFTGTPLHLRMIAEIYQNHFINQYYSHTNLELLKREIYDAFNLINLYEQFIDIKFYMIRFGEKKNCLCSKDPDIKEIIDRERKIFLKNHKILAAFSLLHRTESPKIFSKNDIKLNQDLKQKFYLGQEKTGIIEKIIQNEPKFVHYTYAEYFACEFLFDKLTQTHSIWKYFINYILVMDNGGIREFINAKLEKDPIIISTLTSSCISKALLKKKYSTKTALSQAVLEQHYNIVVFLLDNLEMFLNTTSLDDFIALLTANLISCICKFYNKSNQIVMLKIINIVKRLDCGKLIKLFYCNNNPIDNVFKFIFLHEGFRLSNRKKNNDENDIDLILANNMSPDDLVKLLVTPLSGEFYVHTIVHIAMQQSDVLHLWLYLKKLTHEQLMVVLSTRDEFNRVPAHYAAEMQNYEFFEEMYTILGKEKFRTICTLADPFGRIPLHCFASNFIFNRDKFKLLCGKAGLNFSFITNGGWFLYDIENPNCTWPA